MTLATSYHSTVICFIFILYLLVKWEGMKNKLKSTQSICQKLKDEVLKVQGGTKNEVEKGIKGEYTKKMEMKEEYTKKIEKIETEHTKKVEEMEAELKRWKGDHASEWSEMEEPYISSISDAKRTGK